MKAAEARILIECKSHGIGVIQPKMLLRQEPGATTGATEFGVP